jgi:hypothetical protein
MNGPVGGDATISESARLAYAAGVDPVDWAEGEVTCLFKAHITAGMLLLGAGEVPGPGLSLEAMARRVLGLLLNAGWTAPEVTS